MKAKLSELIGKKISSSELFESLLEFYIVIIYLVEVALKSAISSLSIFAQKYLPKCKDTYFILQNKCPRIYKDSLGSKILRNDCALIPYLKGKE